MNKRLPHDFRSVNNSTRTGPTRGSSLAALPELKPYWLRKSVFNPIQGIAEAIASRMHQVGVEVPAVQVVHYTDRWLLLQAPSFSHNFVSLLKAGKLGNIYSQFLRIFKLFTALTKIYGFFVPTIKMVFMDELSVKVWINEDIFSEKRMIPLSSHQNGQRQFVIAFRESIKKISGWQIPTNVQKIKDMLILLESKSQEHVFKQAVKNQSKVYQSPASYEPNVVCLYSLKPSSTSYHCLESIRKTKLSSVLSGSLNDKSDKIRTVKKLKNSQEETFNETNHEKDATESVDGQLMTDLRQTKKRVTAPQTSSLIENDSNRGRQTISKPHIKYSKPIQKLKRQPSVSHFRSSSAHPGIIKQFQGLFEPEHLKSSANVEQKSLQRIAEQMQQMLIW